MLCVTQANADDSDVMASQEGGDVFALIHHELKICTNSVNLFPAFLFIFSRNVNRYQISKYRMSSMTVNMLIRDGQISDNSHDYL